MSAEHLSDEEYKSHVSAVWRVTIVLSVITILEVAVALAHYYGFLPHFIGRFLLNTFYALLSLLKAAYIIGEFMHLKYEKRALMLSLGFPIVFLVWAIIALLYEGNALHKALYMIQ